jgi:glycosyltransferase involved in cell wall biosynthesis
VLRAYGIDADVCYLGVDEKVFRKHDGERESFALMVGVFARHKNPEFLIRALGATHSKPRLVWIANWVDSTELPSARELAAKLGVSLDIRSNVTDAELVRCYQTARLLVYAPRLEPFGLAPLEAASTGTPVVAVAEGGARETVVDGVTGFVVNPSPEAMAKAVDRLMDDPALASRLGAQGAAIVRDRWTTEAAGARLECALRETIAVARRRNGSAPPDRG